MHLQKYLNKIKDLPNKNKYLKEDILNNNFKLYDKDKMKIFYAPHNEYINIKAKILIVGICPGWSQTEIAYRTAKDGLKKSLEIDKISKECKIEARFAGAMRNNLINMLDDIQLNNKLNILSCSELFLKENNLLHTTSLIPYPIFVNDKNYTGYMPSILDSVVLMTYVKEHFYTEIKKLSKVLIIPLGKSVEEVLKLMINEGLIKEEQCLFNFPHPSGANGHRKKQFEDNKEYLTKKINEFL